ncbi:MAG TPA: glycosyltransferase family 39 protein, partial [Victivallales bacterium]|nr:glycosyltransferase family 39 protein [Victivallales bacterium]
MKDYLKKHKKFVEIVFIFCFVIVIWGFTHFFTLNWGLPNLFSFAIDTIPPQTNFSAIQMMRHENFQYPPLQYKIVELFSPPMTGDEPKEIDILLQHRSNKILKMRLISAIMTLLSALALAFFTRYYFNSNFISLLSVFFFITTPISLYYSHTSNMDQPYLMWWSFSIYSLVLAYFFLKKSQVYYYAILMFFSVVFSALSFCTKDQVYSLYILPMILYLFLIYKLKRGFKYILITLVSWVLIFTIITGAVYWFSGGWNTFFTHIKWIINSEHQILYSQCQSGIFNRIKFILKSVLDLFQCLDFPL